MKRYKSRIVVLLMALSGLYLQSCIITGGTQPDCAATNQNITITVNVGSSGLGSDVEMFAVQLPSSFTINSISYSVDGGAAQAPLASASVVTIAELTWGTAPAGYTWHGYQSTASITGSSGVITLNVNTGATPGTYSDIVYMIGGAQDIGFAGGSPDFAGGVPLTVSATSPTQVAVSIPGSCVATGDAFTVTACAQDAGGATLTGYTGPITLTKASGAGTLSGTTTVNAVNGCATFSGLSLNATGNHTFSATACSATGTSGALNILATCSSCTAPANPANPTITGTPVCGTATLNAMTESGGIELYWQGTNPTGTSTASRATSTYSAAAAGTYYVRAFDPTGGGCWSAGSGSVVVNPVPGAPTAITSPVNACDAQYAGNQVPLTSGAGSNGDRVQWSLNGATVAATNTGNYTTPPIPSGSSQNVWYRTFNSVTGCAGAWTGPLAVNIIARPTAPTAANQSRCGNGNVTFNVTSALGANEIVEWSTDNTTFANPGTTSPSYAVVVGTPITRYVRVRNTVTGCSSTSVTLTGTANANPTAPVISNASICGNGNLTFTYGGALGANEVVEWSTDNTTFANPGTTSPSYAVTVGTPITRYARIRNTVTTCVSTSTTLTGTANANPTAPVISDATVCGNGNVTFNYGGALSANEVVEWSTDNTTFANPGTTSPSYAVTVGTPITRYARIRNTVTTCTSTSTTLTGTAIANPTAPVISDATVCGNGNVTFTYGGALAANEVVEWSTDNTTFANPGTTSPSYAVTVGTPITRYARIRNIVTTCISTSTTLTGTAIANPTAPVISDATVCGNGNVTFTYGGALAANEVVEWSTDNTTFANPGTTSPSYAVVVGTPITRYARIRNTVTGCSSTSTTLTGTAIANPTAPVISDATVCGNGNVTFTYGGALGANEVVEWSTDNTTFANPGTTSPSYAVVVGTPITRYARIRNTVTGCSSTSTTLTGTGIANPAAPVISDAQRCGNGNVTFTYGGALGANEVVEWSTDNTTFANPGTTSPSYAVVVGTPITRYARIRNTVTGCSSTSTTLTGTANAGPLAPTPPATPLSQCGGTSLTFFANDPNSTGNTSLEWSTDNVTFGNPGAGFTVSGLTAPTTATVYVRVTRTDGCTSSSITLNGQLNANPGPPTLDSPTACGNGNITFTANDPGPGFEVRWGTDGTVFGSNGLTYTRPITVGTPVTVYAIVSNMATTCVSTVVNTTGNAVAVPTAPVISNASICGNGNVTFTYGGALGANEVVEWSTDNTTFANPGTTSPSYAVVVGTPITRYARIRNTVTTCVSTSTTLTGTAIANPAAPVISNANICGNGNVTFSYGGALGANEVVEWSTDNTTFANPGTTSPSYAVVVGTPITRYARIRNTVTSCISGSATLTGTAVANPTAPVISDAQRCGNGNVTFTYGGALGANEVVEWSTDNTTFANPGTTSPSYAVVVGTPITRYARIRNTVTTCVSTSTTLTGTAIALPSAPVISNVNICGNGNITFTYAGALGANEVVEWSTDNTTFANPGTTSPSYAVVVGTPITRYARIRNTVTTCVSTSTTLTGTANAVPAAPTVANVNRCGNGNVTFSATNPGAGFSVEWSTDNTTFGSAGLTSPTYAVNVGTPVTVFARVVNTTTTCISTSTSATGTANAVPTAPTVANASRCGNGTVTFTATSALGANEVVEWSTDNTTFGNAGTTSPAYTVNVGTPITRYARVLNTITNCASTSTTITGTANAIPTTPVVGNVARCGNGNVTFNYTGALGANEVIEWSTDNTTFANPGTTSPSFAVTVGTPITVFSRIRNTVTGCFSTSTSSTGTANAFPNPPSVANVQICGNGNLNFVATSALGANEVVEWSTDNTTFANPGTTSPSYAVTVGTPITRYARVRNTATGCISSSTTITGTANAVPTAPTVANQAICGNGNVTFTATNALGANEVVEWSTDNTTFANPGATSPSYAVNVGTPITRFARVRNTVTNCASTSTTVTGTANGIAAAPTVANQAICGNGNVTFTATSALGANEVVEWSTDNTTFANPGASSPSYAVTVGSPITRFARVRNTVTGCISLTTTITGTANAIPVSPIVANVARCANGTVTFSNTQVLGANEIVEWSTDNATFANPGTTSPAYTVNVGTPITRFARIRNTVTGCSSTSVSATGTANANPGAPTVANVARCDNGNVTFTTTTVPGANEVVEWSTDNTTFANPGTTSPSYAVTVGTPITRFARIRNTVTGCISTSTTATGTANALPTAPTVGNQVRCGDGNVTFTATNALGANEVVEWSTDNTTFANPGANSPSYAITVGAPITRFARIRNTVTTCVSSSTTVTGTANAIPATPTVSTQAAQCGAYSNTLTWTNAAGGFTIEWSENGGTTVAGSGTTYSASLADGQTKNVVARVRNDATLCETAWTGPFTVSSNPTPGAATQPTAQPAICGAGSISYTSAAGTNGDQVQWSTDGGTTVAGTGTSFTVNLTAGQTQNIQVRTRNSTTGCVGAWGAIVVATSNLVPTVPVAPASQAICGAGTITFSTTAGANGDQVQWTTDGGGTVLATGNTQNLNVNENQTLNVQVRTRNSTTGCVSAWSTVFTATGKDVPDSAPTGLTDRYTCVDGTVTFTLPALGNANQRYEWSLNGGAFTNGTTATSFTTPVLNSGNSTANVQARILNIAENCPGPVASAQGLWIAVPPSITTLTNQVGCPGDVLTFTVTDVLAGIYGLEWSNDGITYTPGTSTFARSGIPTGTTVTVRARVRHLQSGCVGPVASATGTINDVPATVGPITGLDFVCQDEVVTLSVPTQPGVNSFQWTVPTGWQVQGSSTGSTLTVLVNSTTGTVTARAVNNCGASNTTATHTINVQPNPSGTPVAQFNTTVLQEAFGDPPVFVARFNGNSLGDVHSWTYNGSQIGSGANLTYPFAQGLHTVQYTVRENLPDLSGYCESSGSVTFEVTMRPQILLPNAITPNNDGLNDYLAITTSGAVNLRMLIFDRNGTEVARITNIGDPWYGTHSNGQQLPEGVYVYVLEYTAMIDNTVYRKTGNITILR